MNLGSVHCLRKWGILSLVLPLVAFGCSQSPPHEGVKNEPVPVEVEMIYPRFQPNVREFEEYTGRTEAILTVDLRSRVTGYLKSAPFKEGAEVEKDQLLFEIDPQTYLAEVERTQALVRQGEATLQRLGNDYQRARMLSTNRAISQEEIDRISSSRLEAQAAVAAAKAALETAKLNLGYTSIKAPFAGRISRRYSDPGNLIKADDTILTNLVQVDPIHANFDIDERTVLRLRRLVYENKLDSARTNKITVRLALADQTDFPITGYIDFVDNRLDAGTGTLRIRVEIPNKNKFLSPGMFVRLQLPISRPSEMPLVPEFALANDQGSKGLYIVTNDNKVEYRKVKVGQLYHIEDEQGQHPTNLRIVTAAEPPLQKSDRIIRQPLLGQQAVRLKQTVIPKRKQSEMAGKSKEHRTASLPRQ